MKSRKKKVRVSKHFAGIPRVTRRGVRRGGLQHSWGSGYPGTARQRSPSSHAGQPIAPREYVNKKGFLIWCGLKAKFSKLLKIRWLRYLYKKHKNRKHVQQVEFQKKKSAHPIEHFVDKFYLLHNQAWYYFSELRLNSNNCHS